MQNRDADSKFIPIYQKLYEQYRSGILSQQYLPGSKIDSINDMQRMHNISRETAKHVLRLLSENDLIIQKPGKGSFVCDLGPQKQIWGVIVPYFSALVDQLIYYLRREAARLDRTLSHFVDYNNWQEEVRLVGTLINERYEAVIVVPTFDETKTAAFYKRLHCGGSVVTLMNHTMTGSSFPYVIQSYDLGVKRAVQYLLTRCERNLAFIKNNVWLGPNMVQDVLEENFRSFIEKESADRRSYVVDDVKSITKDWIDQEKVEGIFCFDDSDAVSIIGRLKSWGYAIPQGMAVVSYGNTDLSRYFTPAITSINPHVEKMARILAQIIHENQKGGDVSLYQYVIQPDLVIRDT